MKTYLCAALLGLTAPASAALADMLDDPIQVFASCAGRLSAQMEHQWLLSDPLAQHTEAARGAMLDILASITLPEQTGAALDLRINAKAAHAALLRQATFGQDHLAADRADQLTQHCTSLVIVPQQALETADQS